MRSEGSANAPRTNLGPVVLIFRDELVDKIGNNRSVQFDRCSKWSFSTARTNQAYCLDAVSAGKMM